MRPGDISVAARDVAAIANVRADALDSDGAFPSEDIALLHRRGLLEAPFPIAMGGDGIGIGAPEQLCSVLSSIGRGSLPLGRLYEGHVNAVALVARYGSPANLDLLWREAAAGRLGGVWMAGEPLRLVRERSGFYRLRGRKLLCSGARHIETSARRRRSRWSIAHVIAEPRRHGARRCHRLASAWNARDRQRSTVDFDDLLVDENEVVGSVR